LPADRQAAYADYLKRYFDFGNVFSKSEADLVALNEEFVPYYAAAEPGVYTLQPGRNGGWMTTAMYMSMGQRHDYRSALKNVTAPVLVLHGANDLQPEEASRAYAAAFLQAQFQVIADATHFPFEEQPPVFAEAVSGFLDQLP
jgi:proline iminopeptidase